MIKGKAAYMSPEQAAANNKLDGCSDLSAIGVMLWELLTGQILFNQDTFAAVLGAVRWNEIPRLLVVHPDLVPPDLDAIAVPSARAQRSAPDAPALATNAHSSAPADAGVSPANRKPASAQPAAPRPSQPEDRSDAAPTPNPADAASGTPGKPAARDTPKLAELPLGELAIVVKPWAIVTIDGKLIGQTTSIGSRRLASTTFYARLRTSRKAEHLC